MGMCQQGLVEDVLAGASEDVLAGGVQDPVPTTGWKGGSCTLPIHLLSVIVTEGGEVGMSNL